MQPNTLEHIEKKRIQTSTVWLLMIGMIVMSANLRAPITSVGPVLGIIQEKLSLPASLAGFITSIPLMAFAICSPFAPKWSKRFGMERVLIVALAAIVTGLLLRLVGGLSFLFLGTALVGVGIACGNVLLPALMKRDFATRIGIMTGLYAVVMNVFGALGSGISVPLAQATSWQGALGFWAIPALIAFIIWLPQWRRASRQQVKPVKQTFRQSTALLRSPLAWQVTFFMGMQSFLFYVLITWLPDLLIDKGLTAAQAGVLLSLQQIVLIPFTFAIPIIASRFQKQSVLLSGSALLFLFGIALLWWGQGMAVLVVAIACLGIAGGCAFSLSMMLFSLRTKDAEEASELSGMAQSVGYLLAAAGPALAGALYQASGNWNGPLLLLMLVALILCVAGWLAGRNRFVQMSS
ncbi:MFS transporter [Bacillaceae bacterium SIJ1]|uniref:CynX/NimT family MFS transporter n=1 Tax=Litoribacterium kuwaitense TaxID=1398745 RepID=UPI0013EC6EAE|nr:MFS transporter [Litoribacterium kuwaitense]NGP45283.1 MFS transporter [Litoribacterium kuwaitense]